MPRDRRGVSHSATPTSLILVRRPCGAGSRMTWLLIPRGCGSFTRLSGASRPAQASRPFVYRGSPAVISLRTPPTLATLHAEGERAEWTARNLSLEMPAEAGSLRALQAVDEKPA
jgi:hypothetical protein